MERWSSRLGFVVAAIGAAVGLGNIWRFSAVVGQNGGGAYLVPYLLAAIVLAVPLLILEVSVGRALRLDVVAAFRSVRPAFAALGWVVTGSVILILSYYLVLTGWVLAFFLSALGGTTPSFGAFTATYQPLGYFAVATIATGAVVSLGVRGGIERMSKLVLPVILVVLIGLVAFVATLDGFAAGVAFFLTPDFSVLTDPLLWGAAIGQVFFSLSVGQGIMLTYGSYLSEEANVPRSAVLITVVDIAVAILAGLVIFPVVFTFDLVPTLGTELAFSTLPTAFDAMRFGRPVAIAFFGLLFFAALSSAVGLLEVGVAAVLRTTDRSRRQVTAGATAFVFLLGLPSALSYSAVDLTLLGAPVLDLIDESVGTLALPVTAVVIAIVFTWFQDEATIETQLGETVIVPVVTYVIPRVLIAVTVSKLVAGVTLSSWQILAGERFLGSPHRVAITLVLLAFLFAVGRFLARRLPSRSR